MRWWPWDPLFFVSPASEPTADNVLSQSTPVSLPVYREVKDVKQMARVFITGSADGLGRAAAATLLDEHEVVVHARHKDRLTAVRDLLDRGAAAAAGDLSDLDETRAVADQVNL